MVSNPSPVKKLTVTALLCSLAIIVHSIEAVLPPLIAGVPIKLGLANVFTLSTLMLLPWQYALSLSITRCLVGTLITGAVTQLAYSISGATLSLFTMLLLDKVRKRNKLTAIGQSIAGSFSFNIGQLLVGFFVIGPAMLVYFPLMSLLSIPTGAVTGIISHYINAYLGKYLSKG